jgi:3-oxoadipate enol-lactonase
MRSTEKIAIGAEASLFVETAGQGAPLLLVAGLGDDHTIFDPLVAQIEDQFTCITYDHRGAGDSSPLPEGADIAALAEDGHLLLRKLGLAPIIGVGCSMGGAVVQEWALRYPEDFSKLVLVSTFARPRRYTRARVAHWKALYEAGEMKCLIESIALVCLSPGYWDRDPAFADELLATDELAPGFITQLQACLDHDTLERLGDVEQPTLVIGGSDDLLIPVANSEEIAELLPDATLRVLPTGHVPFWEEPEATAAEIVSFCA